MTQCSAQDAIDLLSNECFRQLRTDGDCGILLREDLDAYELPEGYSKDDVWRILTAIRRQAAIFLPDDPYRTVDCWFVTTSAIAADSKQLEIRSAEGFPLEQDLASLKGSPFVTRFIERTLARAIEPEGLQVSDERIHELFAGAPVLNDVERVITNFFGISAQSELFAERELTHGLIETLYYHLIDGVDLTKIPHRPEVSAIPTGIAPPSFDDCMDAICRRMKPDDGTGDFRFSPVLRIINVSWFFWNFNVFPCLNTLVGVLLRNVMAIKWGYPVISWLPVGYYPFGNLNTPRMESLYYSWSTDYGFGCDFTSYFSTYAKLYLAELERLNSTVAQVQRLNDLVAQTFGADLNSRQQSILSSLCRAPNSRLRISTHQRTFKVSYATARSDFMDLVRKGYLAKEQEGRAFVFRACSYLQEQIVNLGEGILDT